MLWRSIGINLGDVMAEGDNLFAWREVSVILLAVFAAVVVSEFVSAVVRQRIS